MAASGPRPIHHPSLGAYFSALRRETKWSAGRLELEAKKRGHSLTPGEIRGLEEGLTRHPDPVVLRGIAAAYRKPYEVIAARVVAEIYGLPVQADLGRHTLVIEGAQGSPSYVDQLETRVRELEQENARLSRLLEGIKAAVGANVGGQGHQIAKETPRASRRSRAHGRHHAS